MFAKFKVKKPQRSTFSLSHKHETTVNIGDINCLHWNWCFPGDRFKIKYSFLAKFAPMIAPNFSRMRIKSEVFYVPLSDLYAHFHDTLMNYKEESSEEVSNGTKTTVNFSKFPFIRLDALSWWLSRTPSVVQAGESYFENIGDCTVMQQYAVNRLIHQFGVPYDLTSSKIYSSAESPYLINNPYYSSRYIVGDTIDESGNAKDYTYNGQLPLSLFPFQAYQYCYNWFYRDSVRTSEVDIYDDVTSVSDTNNNMRLIGYIVRGVGNSAFYDRLLENATYSQSRSENANRFFNSLFQIRRRFYRKDYFNTAVGDPTVGVDSIAVPGNIVDLRKANQLQKFIEKQALSGNRIAEFIMAHWAYKSDDYELGRPILISTSSQNVQISEVLQTSQTTEGDSGSAQGTRSGTGNSYGDSNGSYFVAPDYGILLINMSIVPEISYFSGMPRKLTPYRWEHFPWPEFSQIGMQPIYGFELAGNDRIQASTSLLDLEDFEVFGYAPRYSEYKMELDQVSGEMATSLRYWHQSPSFYDVPNLNETFGLIGFRDYNSFYSRSQIDEFFYFNQIFAVQDDRVADHCQVVGLFDISVNRALPYNDMPAL